MVLVPVQSLLDRLEHFIPIGLAKGECQGMIKIGFVRQNLESRPQLVRGHLEITLRHGEIRHRQMGVHNGVIGVQCGFEQAIENELRIRTQLQRGNAERGDIDRILIGPGPRAGQAIDLGQRTVGFLRKTVEKENVAGQQFEPDACTERVALEGVGHHINGIRILAGGHLSPDLDERPILIGAIIFKGLVRRFDRGGIFAGGKELQSIGHFRSKGIWQQESR